MMESFLNLGIVTDLLDKEKVEMELMRGKVKKIKEDIERMRVFREASKELGEEKDEEEEKALDDMEKWEKCWKKVLECVEEIEERYERNEIDEEEKEQKEEVINRYIEGISAMEDQLKYETFQLSKKKGVSLGRYLEMIQRIGVRERRKR